MKLKNALVILGLLLCSNFVNAQNTLDNVGLTNTTQASVAYSLRLLSSSYTGPLVRIKVGSLFYDVYPDASTKNFSLSSKISASISTYNAAMAAAGANALSTIITGATDATVAIWYDQSGNGVNVLSSTSTAKIITAGVINLINGQPTVYFNGSTSYLTSSVTVNYSAQTAATINAVVQNVASIDYISGIIATGDNGGWGLCYDPTSTIKGYWIDASGGNGATTNENTTDLKIVTGLISKTANSYIYLNGVVKGTKAAQNTSNGTADKMYIGMRGNFAARQFNGNISEVLMFAKNLTTTEQTTLEASQSIFFPPTVTVTSSAAGAFCAGTNVIFTAVTSGLTSPTYQWYKNSVAISGANASTYSATTLSNNDVINVTCSTSSSIVSDNSLSLWLDAGNVTSYSGSGSTWTDLSGKGNHATFNSHQTYNSSNGGYFQFDGTANPMLINKVTSATTEVTMSAWVYITPGTTQGSFIKNGAGNGYTYGAGGGGGFCGSSFPGMLLAGQSWLGSNPGTSNFLTGWQLCTMVITGTSPTTYKYYINGTLANIATFSSPAIPNGSYTAIGDNYGDGGACTPFNSKMGAAYFYTKALTSSEITQNYNATATRFGLSSSTSITSNSITSTVNALPSANVTVNGDACINKTSLTTSSGLTSYAWYKDNVVISGATSNTYTPSASGVYLVTVSNGTCSNTSSTTTIYNCAVGSDGKMNTTSNSNLAISPEGGANFGTGRDFAGKLYNITGLTTSSGATGVTTAVLGGIISATNAITSSIGVIYSTDFNFGTYTTATLQSNVSAGTYTTTITGLSSSTTYYAKSFIVNKAGTSYGNVVNFTTQDPPKTLGQFYGGGVIFYILKPGDAGYDVNVQHGLIVALVDQSLGIRWNNGTNISISTGSNIGTGSTNTDAIIASQGVSNSYAAGLARAYTGGGFNDWYLPSASELLKLSGSWDGQAYGSGIALYIYAYGATSFQAFGANTYWTSSQADINLAIRQNIGSPSQYYEQKASTFAVRAIRSF